MVMSSSYIPNSDKLVAQSLSSSPCDDCRQFTIPVDLPCVDVGHDDLLSWFSLLTCSKDSGNDLHTSISKSLRQKSNLLETVKTSVCGSTYNCSPIYQYIL